MSDVENVSVALPSEAQWAAGVVPIEALGRAWREGIESGSASPLDFEQVKAKGREMLASEQDRTRP